MSRFPREAHPLNVGENNATWEYQIINVKK